MTSRSGWLRIRHDLIKVFDINKYVTDQYCRSTSGNNCNFLDVKITFLEFAAPSFARATEGKAKKNLKSSSPYFMETSIFLAKVIGLISVISTTVVIIRYKESHVFEEEAVKSSSFMYISGFIILVLGVLIVVSHPVWVLDWRIIITIFGWLVLLKDIGRIFFPDAVKRIVEKKKENRKFILGEIAVFLIGLYLLYYGFIVY